MIDFAALGPYRIDSDSHPMQWDIVDANGELVCEAFHADVAAHLIACLNERHARDTASKAADAARAPCTHASVSAVRVGCPDGRRGCLVLHYQRRCDDCGASVAREASNKEQT